MAPHSSTLAWRIPWAEQPGRLQSMGSLRVGHDWATSRSPFTFIHWRRKWQSTRFFAWRIPWTEEPGGPWSMVHGSQRVGHDWSDWACIIKKNCKNKRLLSGNVQWDNYFGKPFCILLNSYMCITTWCSHLTTIYPRERKAYIHTNIHSSFIFSCPKLETSWTSSA